MSTDPKQKLERENEEHNTRDKNLRLSPIHSISGVYSTAI